jgi:hypothetical protein
MTDRSLPWWQLAVTIAVLALAASANSIANGFAYDDVALIQLSPRLHSWTGTWSEFTKTYWPDGDGYRPLTIIAWRAEWALGNGAPAVFHGVNVVLHVATAVAVLWLAGVILSPLAAWIAAALYAVHPVHAEAIANVVGQSELAVALLVVLAVGIYLRARVRGPVPAGHWVGIGALYGGACLFKEHAIMMPALLVLAESTVVRDAAPWRERIARMRLPFLGMILIGSAYLLIRSSVVESFSGFRPFIVFEALRLSSADRVLTMIGVAPEWLRLLLWPATLSATYGPPEIEIAQGFSVSQIPGFLALVGTIGLMIACWRKNPAVSFGIGWFIVTLLPGSNFLAPAGFIIAERTLLLPSVGAMIAVASALAWIAQRFANRRHMQAAAAAVVVLLVTFGVARSYTRNRAWASDDRLWRQSVLDSPNNYLAHFRLGLHLMSIGDYARGEAHYRRSIDLFPHDPVVAYSFAEQLRGASRCEAAIPLYHWVFSAWPDSRRGHLGYATCLLRLRRFADARREALVWLQRGGAVPLARQVLVAARAGRDSTARSANHR